MDEGSKKDLTSLFDIKPETIEKLTEPTNIDQVDFNQTPTQILQDDLAGLEQPFSPESLPDAETEPGPPAPATPSTEPKNELNQVKEFAEKIAIGQPKLEANPAFSILISSENHRPFSEKVRKQFEITLENLNCGVSFADIARQLDGGKVFIPQISEFAAISIASQLRELVADIELNLAEKIYRAKTLSEDEAKSTVFVSKEQRRQAHAESHDLIHEPKDASELFTTNLSELTGFHISKIIGTLTVSKVIAASLAENTGSPEFEQITEKLTQQLAEQAFILKANGVIGIYFELHPLNQATANYRLLGYGTAIKGFYLD